MQPGQRCSWPRCGRLGQRARTACRRTVPCGTVGLVDVAALRAFPRRVARVHQRHRDPGDGGLVGDELAELTEAPGVRVRALSLANRYPVADAAKVLELDPAPGVFGFADQALLMTWFTSRPNRDSLRRRLASRRLADLVPFDCSRCAAGGCGSGRRGQPSRSERCRPSRWRC